MTNAEFYKKELFDIVCDGYSIGMNKVTNKLEACELLGCRNCSWAGRCSEGLREWCHSEYINKPKLTKNEKKFLDIINHKYKYVTKSKNNILCLSAGIPIRTGNDWIGVNDCAYISENYFNVLFRFIKWDDEEPWLLDDMRKLEICE